MSINRCALVSSKVLLLPSLAATSVCTLSSSCVSSSFNPSSVFAKANASLPVLTLILVGGTTPNPLSSSANLSLLIKSFLVTPAFMRSVSLRIFTFSKCSSSSPRSNSKTASINIRRVASMTRSSLVGKCLTSFLNILWVSSTSLMQ